MQAWSQPSRSTRTTAQPRRGDTRRVASHHALYERIDLARCDVCDAALDSLDDERSPGETVPRAGAGLYVWTRGTEVRFEDAPLCANCGPAIAVTAMRRWAIEDEEEG